MRRVRPIHPELTYRQEAPCNCRRRKASKHIVCAGEMCEAWYGDRLPTALAPHVHLATLGFSSRGTGGMAGCNLHNPTEQTQIKELVGKHKHDIFKGFCFSIELVNCYKLVDTFSSKKIQCNTQPLT